MKRNLSRSNNLYWAAPADPLLKSLSVIIRWTGVRAPLACLLRQIYNRARRSLPTSLVLYRQAVGIRSVVISRLERLILSLLHD